METVNYANNIDFSIINTPIQALVSVTEPSPAKTERKEDYKITKGPNFKSGKRKIPISDPPPTFGTLPSIQAFSSNQNHFIQFGISSNLLLHDKRAFYCGTWREKNSYLEREEEKKNNNGSRKRGKYS